MRTPPVPTCLITADLPTADLIRLDQMAEAQGLARDDLIRQAIDTLLAQEVRSVAVPPPSP